MEEISEIFPDIETESKQNRRECPGCERPRSVCLCSSLKQAQIEKIQGKILILQHPFEYKRRLATVPLLQKCFTKKGDCTVFRNRRMEPEYLQQFIDTNLKILVLYPNKNAEDLHDLVNSEQNFERYKILNEQETNLWQYEHQNRYNENQIVDGYNIINQSDIQSSNKSNILNQKYLLIVFDGTWNWAKYMYAENIGMIRNFFEQRILTVKLNVNQFNLEEQQQKQQQINLGLARVLRKQPVDGGMSTFEAVMRAINLLENWDSNKLYQQLSPIISMSSKQAINDVSLRQRVQELLGNENKCLNFHS